jgi:hypothetical protein
LLHSWLGKWDSVKFRIMFEKIISFYLLLILCNKAFLFILNGLMLQYLLGINTRDILWQGNMFSRFISYWRSGLNINVCHFSFNQNELWTNWIQEIKQGSFIQQTQYFIPVEIDLSVVPARLGISLKSQSQKRFNERKYQYLKYKNKNHSGTDT